MEINDILKLITLHFAITPEEVFQRTNKSHVVFPRQLFFYFCTRYTKKSLREIGETAKKYNVRPYHHATVLHSRETICSLIKTNREVRMEVNEIDPKISTTKQRRIEQLEQENLDLKITLEKRKKGILKETDRELLSIYNKLTQNRKESIMLKIRTELKIQERFVEKIMEE